MKRLALFKGHKRHAGGAVNYKGENEFTFYSRVLPKVKDWIEKNIEDVEVEIFENTNGLYDLARRVKSWGANFCVEFHFNAAAGKAYGCEVLLLKEDIDTHENLYFIADDLTDEFSKEFNIKERRLHSLWSKIKNAIFKFDGIKRLSKGDRGYAYVKAIRDQGIDGFLFEPAFGNFKTKESMAIFENEDKYALFMAKYLSLKVLKGKEKEVEQVPEIPNEVPDVLTSEESWLDVVVRVLKWLISFLTEAKDETEAIEKPNISDLFIKLVKEWCDEKVISESYREAVVAQWLHETGKGTSNLFKLHKNAGGMKFRDDTAEIRSIPVKKVRYEAHDGYDYYAGFESLKDFIQYYKAFINRSYYDGWEDAATKDGMKYIEHIFNAGYATDKKYVSKVKSHLSLAKELIKYVRQ